jgi:hypothetical protein
VINDCKSSGALGGGLVGYELGQAMADNEQLALEGVLANAEPPFESMPQGEGDGREGLP